GGSFSWECDHVKAHGADCSHGFKLVHGDSARAHRIDHALIFGNRDEGTRKTTHARACHHAALLDCIVKQCERRGGAMGADLIQDVRNRIAQFCSRSQGKVHDAKWHAQALSGHIAHQLTGASDLKGGLFNLFGNLVQGSTGEIAQGAVNDAGARYADGDHAIWLLDAVESTGHEWVISDGVCKDHELRAGDCRIIFG